MRHCNPDFLKLLDKFDLKELNEHSSAVYGVTADLRLACFNKAWFIFAEQNSGLEAILRDWNIGAVITDAYSESIRGFYSTGYRNALDTMKVWEHDYECPSAKLYRLFHQRVYPLGSGQGLLIVNSLRIERPHGQPEEAFASMVTQEYRDKEGFFHQCSHCRRMQHINNPSRWDWIPSMIAQPPRQVSHGLCSVCADYYYKQKAW